MVLRSKLVSERISPFPRRSSFVLHVIGIARMQLLERTRPCTIGAPQLNDVLKLLDLMIPFSPLSLSHDPISPLIRTRMSSVYGTDLGRVKWAGHFIVGVDATPPQRKAITNSVAVIPRNRTQLWCGVEKHELIAPFASFHFKTYSRRVYTN